MYTCLATLKIDGLAAVGGERGFPERLRLRLQYGQRERQNSETITRAQRDERQRDRQRELCYRVCVADASDVLRGRAILHSKRSLVDQLARNLRCSTT